MKRPERSAAHPILAAQAPVREAEVSLRLSTFADDVACGHIVGRSAGQAVMAKRVPFAAARMRQGHPLKIVGRQERIVALAGERIVGFAQFDPRERFLWYLFVDPDEQGGGVGSLLLSAVETRTGYPLSLRTLAVNDPALKFYLRRGYKIRDGWIEDEWHGGSVVWIVVEKAHAMQEGAGRFG